MNAENVRMHTTARLLTRIAAALATAVALAGCGTTSSAGSSGNSAAQGTTTTSTVTTTSTSASATTTSTATPTAGPGECRASELVLTFLGGQGATGHGELGFALRNKGAHRCHTGGYPGVAFLGRHGRRLPTDPVHSTTDFFGHTPLRALGLAPGASASFRLDVSHGSGSRGVCPTAAALQMIPPDDTHALTSSITGGAYECGKAIVSPLQAGRSAYP